MRHAFNGTARNFEQFDLEHFAKSDLSYVPTSFAEMENAVADTPAIKGFIDNGMPEYHSSVGRTC